MGEPVEHVLCRPQASVLERADDDLRPFLQRRGDSMDDERLADGAKHGVPRIQGLIRILEDHLDVPPEFE